MDTGASGTGRKGRIRAQNQKMAAAMKAAGMERTSGRCAVCYKIVAVDCVVWTNSEGYVVKSRYTHICK